MWFTITNSAGYLYLIHCLHHSLLSFNVLCFWLLQNELAILEFIQLVVQTMDRHFGNVASPNAKDDVFLPHVDGLILGLSSLSPRLSPGFPLLPSDRSLPFLFVLICFSYLQCELEIMFHLEKSSFHAGRDCHEWFALMRQATLTFWARQLHWWTKHLTWLVRCYRSFLDSWWVSILVYPLVYK